MSDHVAFLQQEIESATPAKLRWMLLRRASGLCQMIDQYWQQGDLAIGQQWLIQMQDLLGELLNGVTDPENPVAKSIVDLYVYLIQQAHLLYTQPDLAQLKAFADILAIEEGTWKAFVDQENRAQMIHLATHQAHIAQRVDATIESINAVIDQAETRPLNLEC